MVQNKNEKFNKQQSNPAIDLRFGKVPPQAQELEGAVLGACMLDSSAYDNAADILSPGCFYSEANQKVFTAMQSLMAKNLPIDLLTVVEEMHKAGDLDKVGGPYYVSKLTNNVVSGANIETHARIVLQKFISREVIRIAGEMIADAYDAGTDVFDLLDNSEEKLMKISSTAINGDMVPMSKVLFNTQKKIEAWRQSDGMITGVPSGFEKLDRATRGWQPGDLIIIGARPSIGKTAMALNLARNAALNSNKPTTVAFWSLEMNSEYLALRMIAAESEIYLHRIQTGRLNDDQMQDLIKKGINKLASAKIFFDDSSEVNIRTLRSKSRKLKKKNNLGLIIVDYLQLMSGEENKGNREQEVSKISRALKKLAKELQVPVIALSQITRDAEKYISWDHGPGPSSLRESGSIEQDADVIIMLWGPTKVEIAENKDLDGKRRAGIVKQRNGMLVTADLDFKNEIQLFQAMQTNFNLPVPGTTAPSSGFDEDAPF